MKKLLLAGFASFLSITAAQAVPFGPASIVVAGTTYSGFDVVLTGNGPPTLPSQISVTPNVFGNGIAFTSSFQSGAVFTDAAITFLASNPGGITGANLNISAGTFLGLAVANVSETIFNAANNAALINLSAFCTTASCTAQDTTDPDTGFRSLGGSFTSLRVQKDINVTANGGSATISIVNEGFQTTTVPEPMSLALLGAGLVGLGLVRRAKAS